MEKEGLFISTVVLNIYKNGDEVNDIVYILDLSST